MQNNMSWLLRLVYLVSYITTYLPICHCHSRLEGHFTNQGKQSVKVDLENILEKRQVRDLLACAKVCVTLPQCNALFYNKASRQCVLHKNLIDSLKPEDRGEWRFWRRQNPYTDILNNKTPYMLVFMIHSNVSPYWVNLDTEEWGSVELPRTHFLNTQVNQAAYDDETGIMYVVPEQKLMSFKIRSVKDIKDAKGKEYLQGVPVSGIGYDKNQKRLFLMIGRGVATMKPDEDEDNYDMLWNGVLQSHDSLCKIAVDTKKQFIYFHSRAIKGIFRCNYRGKGKKVFKSAVSEWISLDFEGRCRTT
ncbi:uncharacterized protein LOC125378405 [Haliotis rufescens]|uniref:uncharacterized protein LOC125378405 n=1 Tax=Haliotis rufescens TaxID=6454 RepID=UPI00201F532E|nr:uncharacterized protein LOC125378405 [Haliotis rufescens]